MSFCSFQDQWNSNCPTYAKFNDGFLSHCAQIVKLVIVMPFISLAESLLILTLVWHTGGFAFARQRPPVIDGITFAGARTVLFVPAHEVATLLGYPLHWDTTSRKLFINNRVVAGRNLRRMPNGAILIPVALLTSVGARISWDGIRKTAALSDGLHQVQVRKGAKRVVVDRSKQQLIARQGQRIVLKAPISTGVEGHNTPLGTFGAGPMKRPLHRSRRYHNVPMRWAIQVEGNVFIHGFAKVGNRPSSHGCIRLPVTHGNPAKWLYDWVEIGTPITVASNW
jgi:hypothetical protein